MPQIEVRKLAKEKRRILSVVGVVIAASIGAIIPFVGVQNSQAITMTMPTVDWIINSTETNTALSNSSDYLSDFGSNRIFAAIALQGGPANAYLYIPKASGQSDTTARVFTLANSETVTVGFGFCTNTSFATVTVNGSSTDCTLNNSLNKFTNIAMRGSQTNINTLLSQLRYMRASTSDQGTPSVIISATIDVPGVTYYFDGLNDHYYRVGHYTQNNSGNLPAETSGDPGYYCSSSTSPSAPTETVNSDSNYQNALLAEGLTVSAKAKRPNTSNGEGNCSWNEADRLARLSTFKRQRGYLANITSSTENDLLQRNLAGAINTWFGGTDGACDGSHSNRTLSGFNINSDTSSATACANNTTDGTEGVFRYYDGPEKDTVFWRWSNSSGPGTGQYGSYEKTGYGPSSGAVLSGQYANFSAGEPNNSSSSFTASSSPAGTFRSGDPNTTTSASTQGEDNLVFNWVTANGKWNDLHQREPSVNFYGFIIEYGGTGFDSFNGILRENKPILFSTPINRIPDVIPVDPRTNSFNMPSDMLVIGIRNTLVCFNEWNTTTNAQTATPVLNFDVDNQNTNDSTATGPPVVVGDQSTALSIRSDSSTVFSKINANQGLRVYLSSGVFSDTRYFRVRVVPLALSTSTGVCGNASINGSKTVEIRPIGLDSIMRKPTIQLRQQQ